MNVTSHNPDHSNMIGYIDALPSDLEKAWRLGLELPLPDYPQIERVLIAGMGGSAIGGDLLAAFMAAEGTVPVISHRGYGLPAWARGKATLVVCSSHSGNTEETLSAAEMAIAQGCSVLALCTGGKLAQLAGAKELPFWQFEHNGQPRTAVAYSFGILLGLCCRLGLVPEASEQIAEAAQVMRSAQARLGIGTELASNPAKRLAGQLMERNIAVFAAGELEVVARRWKTQINELAKAWASFEGLPEANHNTLAALIHPESLYEKTFALFLRAEMDHPRNKLRLDATRSAFLQAGSGTDIVTASGTSRLAQMWSLLQYGDYVSYYLALLYHEDPTPVAALLALKERLAKSG